MCKETSTLSSHSEDTAWQLLRGRGWGQWSLQWGSQDSFQKKHWHFAPSLHPPLPLNQRRQRHPLQHSCLESPMDGGAWWAAVHGVAKSRTRLSDFPFTFHFHALEKEMATHSSVLAWRIPGTGEPGMQPRDPCLPWRGILGPGHTPKKIKGLKK